MLWQLTWTTTVSSICVNKIQTMSSSLTSRWKSLRKRQSHKRFPSKPNLSKLSTEISMWLVVCFVTSKTMRIKWLETALRLIRTWMSSNRRRWRQPGSDLPLLLSMKGTSWPWVASRRQMIRQWSARLLIRRPTTGLGLPHYPTPLLIPQLSSWVAQKSTWCLESRPMLRTHAS